MNTALTTTRALIFDMDGTMIDSMPTHFRAWETFMQRHTLQVPIHDLMRRITGLNGRECMSEAFGREMTEAQAAPLVLEKQQIYRTMFAASFAEIRGFAKFAQYARSLRLKIGIGTAGDRLNVEFALAQLALSQQPDAVVRGDMGLPGKPDPAIFLEASRLMNTKASEAIVFEDAPLGIEAARRAGMRAVAICSTHSAQELAGSHVIAAVKDYDELMQLGLFQQLHLDSK